MFTIIAGALIAIIAAGLLATLVVKLVTTVGKYIIKKVKENRRRRSLAEMKKILDEINKNVAANQAEQAKHELSNDDLLSWENDSNGNVIEDSIEIYKAEQVDNHTRKIMNDHDGLVLINPPAA